LARQQQQSSEIASSVAMSELQQQHEAVAWGGAEDESTDRGTGRAALANANAVTLRQHTSFCHRP
jgi:hypothetical protein